MSCQRLVALTLLLGTLMLSGLPALTVAQQADAAFFDQVVNGELSAPLLAGPYDFDLEQQPGVLSVYRAGLDVADFVAHAAFTNPASDDGTAWDYGFQFRTTGNNEDFRLFVVSDGTWNFAIGLEPPEQIVAAPGLDVAPGAVNTLDLIVQDLTALFGINGEFVAAIALPELSPTGDVFASTGFFGDLAVPGRIIQLSDFTVYGVPGEEAAAAPAIQTTGEVPPARPVTLHAGTCDALGEPVELLREATYPVGTPEGLASAVVAETSFTRIVSLVDDLMLEPHAINVGLSFDAPDVSIACGDIGGIIDEIGGYVFALSERNGSGYRGVVYLAADPERGGSNISVFLVPGPAAPAAAEEPGVAEEAPVVEETVVIEEAAAPEATPQAITIEIDESTPAAPLGTPEATPAA